MSRAILAAAAEDPALLDPARASVRKAFDDAAAGSSPPELGWDAAEALRSLGGRARVSPGLDELEAILLGEVKAGDRVIMMSNGSFGGLHQRLLEGLRDRERGTGE